MDNIYEGNILIAEKLLNLDRAELSNKYFFIEFNNDEQLYKETDLKFHSDSNWQWLCLEKIMKDNELYSIGQVYLLLEDIMSEKNDESFDIKTKMNLFDAIIGYIKE